MASNLLAMASTMVLGDVPRVLVAYLKLLASYRTAVVGAPRICPIKSTTHGPVIFLCIEPAPARPSRPLPDLPQQVLLGAVNGLVILSAGRLESSGDPKIELEH